MALKDDIKRWNNEQLEEQYYSGFRFLTQEAVEIYSAEFAARGIVLKPWSIKRDGTETGPFSREELLAKGHDGEISEDVLIRHRATGHLYESRQVVGLEVVGRTLSDEERQQQATANEVFTRRMWLSQISLIANWVMWIGLAIWQFATEHYFSAVWNATMMTFAVFSYHRYRSLVYKGYRDVFWSTVATALLNAGIMVVSGFHIPSCVVIVASCWGAYAVYQTRSGFKKTSLETIRL